MSRIETSREDWPFQPWPARSRDRFGGWDDEIRKAAMASRTAGHTWLLLALLATLVAGFAGAAVMTYWFVEDIGSLVDDTRDGASSDNKRGGSAPPDQHIAALLLEHRRVVRGW